MLSRQQFRLCVNLINPYVNTTADERQALVTRALYGSRVLDQLTWTGGSLVFATNFVRALDKFDGTDSLVQFLKTLYDEVGASKAVEITNLINDLTAQTPEIAKYEPDKEVTTHSAEYRSLTRQIEQHQRNLNHLEEMRSKYGIRVPLDLLNEIENEQDQVREKLKKLAL